MNQLLDSKIENYAAHFTSSTDALLKEIEEYTMKNHPQSIMLSGPVQGKLLEIISYMIQPEKILEIGTFMGYSALCLAKGLKPGGVLHTLELKEEDAIRAQNYFTKSSQHDQINLHLGDALIIIPGLDEIWDLVFIDADKVNYINYYELTLPRLRKGGFILADNVLFHGEVLEEKIMGKNALAIQAFNEYVAADERVEQVMLTVRDGLMCIVKK